MFNMSSGLPPLPKFGLTGYPRVGYTVVPCHQIAKQAVVIGYGSKGPSTKLCPSGASSWDNWFQTTDKKQGCQQPQWGPRCF